MTDKLEDLIRRPLYAFDLPREILATLELKDASKLDSDLKGNDPALDSSNASQTSDHESADGVKSSTSCGLCNASFGNLQGQRRHVKSDWHGYNLKQSLRGQEPVNEAEFEKLLEKLDESISGSESSASEELESGNSKDTLLSNLLKKHAKLHPTAGEEPLQSSSTSHPGRSPLIWFRSSSLPQNVSLGLYRAILTSEDQAQASLVDCIRKKQLKPIEPQKPQTEAGGVALHNQNSGPSIFLCMIGGGHFAAMIVLLTPKMVKKPGGAEERQAVVLNHKTFHRYTTRRKQGGSQSANDSANGAAHSAGAGIRRYNESALELEVRALLAEWKTALSTCELLFVRATGAANRRTLFGPYDGQVLRPNDDRNRSFPFTTRRATQAELMRAFVELTRMKVSEVSEASLATAEQETAKQTPSAAKGLVVATKSAPSKPSKEVETALFHTSQLQALIRRSKAPAMLAYLSSNSLSADFPFYPPTTQANHHASTPLHLAASINSPIMVMALLTKGGADPSVLNGEGKPAFDAAGDRATRDAFRVARSELGEEIWNWTAAHCPPPLTKTEAEHRQDQEKQELVEAEAGRRAADLQRIRQREESDRDKSGSKSANGKALGTIEMTGADRREQETRGLTPEIRAKLERERRARAAEERIRQIAR